MCVCVSLGLCWDFGLHMSSLFLISDILTKLLLNFVPNVFVAIRVDMHVSLRSHICS